MLAKNVYSMCVLNLNLRYWTNMNQKIIFYFSVEIIHAIELCTRRYVSRAILVCCCCCCCYILVVLTRHLFENPNVFYVVKVLYVQILRLWKKKMTLVCKDKVLSHVKTFLLIFKKFSLWSKLTAKRSEFFAVNHEMQKLSF